MPPDAEKILASMLLIRRTEEGIVHRYSQQGMRCPVHLSVGMEAIAVGACHHLKPADRVFSTHRCHAHYLAKGGSLEKMALELYGKIGGCMDGRGGSMHLQDNQAGVFSVPIVASSIPLAVGAALVEKMDKTGNIIIAFFGDAAIEEGVFAESMNFASLHNLPIIFICENNLYSVDTHIDQRQPPRAISNSAMAHGMANFHLNGNDPYKVARVFGMLIDEARKGTPYFVVISGYRKYEHCGVNLEEHPVHCKDPLETAMVSSGLPANVITEIDATVLRTVRNAFGAAELAPLPTPEMADEFVYAN